MIKRFDNPLWSWLDKMAFGFAHVGEGLVTVLTLGIFRVDWAYQYATYTMKRAHKKQNGNTST